MAGIFSLFSNLGSGSGRLGALAGGLIEDPNKMVNDAKNGSISSNNSVMSGSPLLLRHLDKGSSGSPGVVATDKGPYSSIGPSSVDGVGSMVKDQIANEVSRSATPVNAPSQAGTIDPFNMPPSSYITADGGGFMGTLGRMGADVGTFFNGIDQGIGALNDSALVSGYRDAMDTIGNSFIGDMSRGFSKGMSAYKGEDPPSIFIPSMFPGGDPAADPMADMSIKELEARIAEMYAKQDQDSKQAGF